MTSKRHQGINRSHWPIRGRRWPVNGISAVFSLTLGSTQKELVLSQLSCPYLYKAKQDLLCSVLIKITDRERKPLARACVELCNKQQPSL
jgi:hypothetical protein